MAPDDQLRIFLEALDPALPAALDVPAFGRVAAAYQEPTLAHRPDITPGAVEAVRELRARGLRLGLISNTGRTPGRVLRRLLEDADLLSCFDVLVFSDEARVRKPATAIFRQVLDEARVDPERAVHVGDDAVKRRGGRPGRRHAGDPLRARRPGLRGAGRRRAAAASPTCRTSWSGSDGPDRRLLAAVRHATERGRLTDEPGRIEAALR